MKNLNDIKLEKRWVCYTLKEKDGKKTKIPISPITGKGASSVKSEDWDTYENALSYSKAKGLNGVGLVLTGDGLSCVDLDGCIENGKMNPKALKIISQLNSYTEKSVSGNGVHIFLYCQDKFEKTRSSKTEIPIEIYTERRYIVFTNDMLNDLDFEERSSELKSVYNSLFNGNDFLEKIKRNKYDYEKFLRLNSGDISEYNYDHSAADLGFMNLISKYAKDPDECDRVFRESSLNRDKYINRADYRDRLLKLVEKNFNKVSVQREKKKINNEYLTDYEVCLLLKSKYDNFIYNIDDNFYYYFNGKYYKKDNTNVLIKCLTTVINDFVNNCGWCERSIQKVRKKYLGDIGSKAIVHYYKTLPMIAKRQEYFNKHKNLICCKNGVVNLKTGELLDFSKDYLITQYVDINFNRDVTPKGSVFQKYIFRTTENDEEKINYLQVLAGYCLTGETGEQSFYYLIGQAATGKSVFVELLKMISGTNAKTVPVNCFDVKSNDFLTNMASVSDCRLVLSAEENACTKMNTSLVKQLTGEDTITARYLYSMIFSYKPQFKILVSSNEMPQMYSDVASMKRRLKAIPFDNFVKEEERDRHLFKKLEKEKELIFNWAVCGAIKYYETGFPKPKFLKETVDEIFDEQDLFTYWVNEYFEKDPESFISTKDLWLSYSNFCEREESPRGFKSILCFSRWLNQKDYVKKGTKNNTKGFFGLKRKNITNINY